MDTCRDCLYEFKARKQPEWFRNAMIGETPIKYKAVKVGGLRQRWSHSYSPEDDDVWRKILEPYPQLNQPFTHIGELFDQWLAFEKWRKARQEASWRSIGRKRKRSSTESSNEDTADIDTHTSSADESWDSDW
jgi:hypothetical protein